MTWAIRGLIEGFYGPPWTWDQRIDVARWCATRGMTHYVYAPKSDPLHRDRWREPYGSDQLDGFARLLSEGGLTVGFAISPGLDIDHSSSDDRRALFAKVEQAVDLGVGLVVLALDDIAFSPDAGTAHAALTTDLVDHLAGRAEVVLVPTDYVGTSGSVYLDALVSGLPDDVAVAWTGPAVVNDTITAADARLRSEALAGRPPLLWDNYPVNDALMADRLFLGPLWGREPALADACSGYLANPMVQPHCSKLPLASIAAFLRGEDPLDAWVGEAGALRVLAEACDAAVPQGLVSAFVGQADTPGWAFAAQPLVEWLLAASTCDAAGLEGEADDWLRQTHREATLGLSALRLLQATRPVVLVDDSGSGHLIPPQPDVVLAEAFTIASRWPRVRRSAHTVMGTRCSFRPLMTTTPAGGWRILRAAIEENTNAIDALVRLALDALDGEPEPPGSVRLRADGEPVEVADDGTFRVRPGADVVASCGSAVTAVRAPAGQPVPPGPAR